MTDALPPLAPESRTGAVVLHPLARLRLATAFQATPGADGPTEDHLDTRLGVFHLHDSQAAVEAIRDLFPPGRTPGLEGIHGEVLLYEFTRAVHDTRPGGSRPWSPLDDDLGHELAWHLAHDLLTVGPVLPPVALRDVYHLREQMGRPRRRTPLRPYTDRIERLYFAFRSTDGVILAATDQPEQGVGTFHLHDPSAVSAALRAEYPATHQPDLAGEAADVLLYYLTSALQDVRPGEGALRSVFDSRVASELAWRLQ